MIEKINLKNFKITSNHLLVKCDPQYDVLVVNGPEGRKIELQLIATDPQDQINHVSISGSVIRKPDNVFFYEMGYEMSRDEHASNMLGSLDQKSEYAIEEGTKVFFNYNVQLNAEEEYRLVETDEYGICMLINYNRLFGYQQGEEIIPVNGYVFFKRDEQADRIELDNGIIGIQKANKYGSLTGTVTIADVSVPIYLDGDEDPDVELLPGQRIVIDKRFGYRMAYDLHGGKLEKVEVCLRKNILALL